MALQESGRRSRGTPRFRKEIACSPALQRLIGVPRKLHNLLGTVRSESSLRTLRFDFHPTATGWVVSEVNSDVPGGFGEASALPQLFEAFREGAILPIDPLFAWGTAAKAMVGRGHVALLHAPGYLEDQQVVLVLARELKRRGLVPHLV